MLRHIAGLPPEVRQLCRKVSGVLAGSRADLQHAMDISERSRQAREDWIPVALAGLGKRLLINVDLTPFF
jgi:hypothetical protein